MEDKQPTQGRHPCLCLITIGISHKAVNAVSLCMQNSAKYKIIQSRKQSSGRGS